MGVQSVKLKAQVVGVTSTVLYLHDSPVLENMDGWVL